MTIKTFTQSLSSSYGEIIPFPTPMYQLNGKKIISILALSGTIAVTGYVRRAPSGNDLITRGECLGFRVTLVNSLFEESYSNIPLSVFIITAQTDIFTFRSTRSGLFQPVGQVISWGDCFVENVAQSVSGELLWQVSYED